MAHLTEQPSTITVAILRSDDADGRGNTKGTAIPYKSYEGATYMQSIEVEGIL